MRRPTYRTKTLSVADGERFSIDNFPNISASGSVMGMKNLYWGINALCVRCGGYIYNVTSMPKIYDAAY